MLFPGFIVTLCCAFIGSGDYATLPAEAPEAEIGLKMRMPRESTGSRRKGFVIERLPIQIA
jgi:hypothetical protein